MEPKQNIRRGDILHVPFRDGCAEYLVVKRDMIVIVQKSPKGGGDFYGIETTENMTHHWSGIHLNTLCRAPDFDYEDQGLVWRDA